MPNRTENTIETIPPDILLTSLRPDLSMFHKQKKEAILVELSVCWDIDHNDARQRKEARYAQLTSELIEKGWKTKLITLEIGSRGFTGPDTRRSLSILFKPKKTCNKLLDQLNKIAVMSSYVIFHNRNTVVWQSPQLVEP